MEDAPRHGFKIEHVIETHLHADFISGHQELSALTGAKIYLGAQAGAKFPHVPVHDGDEVRFGKCVLRFLETPGHTAESISVLVTDTERSAEPWAVLTGDTLLIGDVGRPDLSPNHTPQQLAGLLYDSLQTKLLPVPDDVQVFPAHGSGSLCGRQLSTERSSTIGQQRATNYALQTKSRDEFVHLLTSELPERPGYFAPGCGDQPVGPGAAGRPGATAGDECARDGSAPASGRGGAGHAAGDPDCGAGHIPGAVPVLGLVGQYASWAGRLIGLKDEIVLVTEDHEAMLDSRVRLARVGMERVFGLPGGRHGSPRGCRWRKRIRSPCRNWRELGHVQVVDVRQPGEWEQGHIPGATLKPLPKLAQSVDGLDRERTVAVHCKSGYRSLDRGESAAAGRVSGSGECGGRVRCVGGVRAAGDAGGVRPEERSIAVPSASDNTGERHAACTGWRHEAARFVVNCRSVAAVRGPSRSRACTAPGRPHSWLFGVKRHGGPDPRFRHTQSVIGRKPGYYAAPVSIQGWFGV